MGMRSEVMEAIERAERLEVAALQERLVRSQVQKAWATVPFYRSCWEAAGLSPEKITSLEDVRKLPIVTKEDFTRDLEDHPPFGSYQGMGSPVRMHASSGTTGKARPVFCSRSDCEWIAKLSARRLRAQGVTPADRVQVTLPYTLYIGGAIALEGAMRLGACVIPTGTGAMTPSQRQIQIARDWQSTVLCATPSYALRLSEVASEMGLNSAHDFHFRIVYVTGEVLPPETRKELEQRWNSQVYDNYGTVEAAASTFECQFHSGWHISEDAYLFEVVDPGTHEPVPPGEEGVLVVTSLFRECSPFIRYKVGDIVALWEEPCACGRTFRRMSPTKGRADDMLKLRGVSVYPTAVERALGSFRELGSEWYLVVDRQGAAQEIIVQVEAASHLSEEERVILATRVSDRLKQEIGVRPEVEIFPPGALIPEEAAEARVKARRIIERGAVSMASGQGTKRQSSSD